MSSQSKVKKKVEKTVLPGIDSLYISNFLINASIQEYVKEFNSSVIPFSYIEMFFDAMKHSKTIQETSLLREFFKDETTVEVLCYVYFLTFKTIVSAVIEDKKYGLAIVLKKKQAPQMLSLFLRDTTNVSSALEIIQDQKLAFAGQSPHYTKKAYTKYLAGSKTYITDALQNIDSYTNTNDLVGKEVDIPNIEGKKIYQLYIPSLPLPTAYPKKASRVHSSYHISQITGPSKMLDMLTLLNITHVKYSNGFVALRSDAAPKKEKKKLEWSDFF